MRFILVAVLLLISGQTRGAESFSWKLDYSQAYAQARDEGKLLLIWFRSGQQSSTEQKFEKLWNHEKLAQPLESYVGVQIAKGAKVTVSGKDYQLLEHPAFAEMLRSPGLAIIDLRDKENGYYGDVVSVLPYGRTPAASAGELYRLQVLLTLPTGTLTQRTLIYAVRTHREYPRSTQGVLDPLLASETAKHSHHQASIRLQGHHNWDRRFQLISSRLPDRLLAQEVCAESWPGQGLVAAAEECVDSWRQSSGHWSAVSAWHPRYGYDMRRGSNGVWYATGIFGKR